MRTIVLTIVTILLAAFLAHGARAEKRVALVVGNSTYQNISALSNPKKDAATMALALRELDFEVVTAIDADRRAMGRAIRKFGKALRLAGKDAVGLFYFAGHGVQARGTNYLIPVNATIEDHADLDLEAVSASNVLTQMESAGNALNLIILDACRNNPFKGQFRTASRGLARITAASGSLIAFAAAPGQVAADGKWDNSPYTAALVEAMRKPGLTVEQMFKRVRVRVERETNGKQTPWEESSLLGDFYFVANPETAAVPVIDTSTEITFWNTIKDSGEIRLFQAYLEQYPNGSFARLAKIMVERITADEAEQQVASVEPEAITAPEVEKEPDPELPRNIQMALSKAGCNPGKVDGQWGRNSQKALDRFARHAKLTVPGEPVSAETLKLFDGRDGRTCPLLCGVRQVEKNGRCVTKTCSSGLQLNRKGTCVARVRAAPSKPTTAASQPRRKKVTKRKHAECVGSDDIKSFGSGC